MTDGVDFLAMLKLGEFIGPRVKPDYEGLSANELVALEERGTKVVDGYNLRFEKLPDLLTQAEHDLIAFEALRRLAVMACRQGDVPLTLSQWIADYLAGGARPPAKPGMHPRANLLRDVQIVCDIYRLTAEQGIAATRNDASATISACDIVAERHGLKFSTVKGIWRKHAHRRG